jgi:hypothetical protein
MADETGDAAPRTLDTWVGADVKAIREYLIAEGATLIDEAKVTGDAPAIMQWHGGPTADLVRRRFRSAAGTSLTPPAGITVLLDHMVVVLIGSFNPTIFQPAWFARYELIRQAEADAAEVKLITPQLAHFSTDWLELMVTRERFSAFDRNGGLELLLRDLVRSTFTLLDHTPITAMGINREVKLEFETMERWHSFGHALAPKDVWSRALDEPGLVGLQMQGAREGDGNKVNVIVQNTGNRRVDVNINEHRAVVDAQAAGPALEILQSSWTYCRSQSDRIITQLLSIA